MSSTSTVACISPACEVRTSKPGRPAMPAQSTVRIDNVDVPLLSANTVVVGTGAAGYCAADRLVQYGQRDVLVISDRITAGSSRNAGSDKQTYYKLTLGGEAGDSVSEMARTLYDGGAMDGDHALVEAALSPQAFLHLVDLGVEFPRNRFGEFVGYKTDHDPRQRATSVGPYTSRTMVERLEQKVLAEGIHVVEGLRIVDILANDGEAVGLLCLRRRTTRGEVESGQSRFLLVRARSVVYATGGPAGMYARSVFPHGQWGASGAAYRAGATGKNLTEWQFGLASIAPRWNVSGSYMQVLPTFVSTDADGNGEREFLTEAIPDYGRQLSLIFLKGYQWPFDVRKARDGSSLIDLLVYRETVIRGRRVFLDFTRNPYGRDLDAGALEPPARNYLERAGVLFGTPAQRLQSMNRPAYELYREKNPSIDLMHERLEVDLCVQHNNGGLAVDSWWQSVSLPGLFPVGEAAGSHGVYRPGGAALNATQVGAMRAAQWITARRTDGLPDMADFLAAARPALAEAAALLDAAAGRVAAGRPDSTGLLLRRITGLMSEKAGPIRSAASVHQALADVRGYLEGLAEEAAVDASSRRSVDRLFLLRDILTSQFVYLTAMTDYLAHGGHSRGSVLYTDAAGELPGCAVGVGGDDTAMADGVQCHAGEDKPGLPEEFRFLLDDGELDDQIQEIRLGLQPQLQARATWRTRRSIPDTSGDFFENVWREFREDHNIR
ncbi:FAD-binding protein [Actinomyces sp. MRS3W]|uniref:FAD-binding protein n=1 Tax=Actinomyces sp. MRS3W TaxID=2800796 RepID=UPI0028FD8FFC|nr:FAD-binding protein [Actinomyces sp. MRS3W]MDU0348924.1 FAD-binding protein [Actinomyces sp. MRS3W]